jgi:hypothetical protein
MRRFRLFIGLQLLLIVLLVGGYGIWYFNRPLPAPITEHAIFEGITYERVVQRDSHPLIYHVVTVDLDAPGIAFLVTPPDDLEGFDYAARTTSQFLADYGVQLAINGDFYNPWRDFGPLDYYPHVGDGVNTRGLTISQNQTVTNGYAPESNFATLYVTHDNQIAFRQPDSDYQQAVSGLRFIEDGDYVGNWGSDTYLTQLHPRTIAALDADGRTLIVIVVDGRQPNFSEGVSLSDLTVLVLQYGGYDAINLDGGGSSTLVQMGANGQPLLLNSPIHTRIPGRERPIANHLGIFANPLPNSSSDQR